MTRSRTWSARLLAMLLIFSLVAAACGGDDDTTSNETTGTTGETDEGGTTGETDEGGTTGETDEGGSDESMPEGGMVATEGTVEIATGTTVNLDECEDWSPTTGVDGDEIRLGISLPQSGALAGFGPIADGMTAYFDWVNENEPIAGKQIKLIVRDDAYEAGRTVANIEEMIDTEDIFAFAGIIGSPNNVAARPILDEACIPQIFNLTGLPNWGDPANYPWTIGGLLSYTTEASLWCENIVAEKGEGATVAALFMNNDFGKAYQVGIEKCAADGKIDLVANQVHEAAAPDIQNEMTNMIDTGADAFIFGSTAAFCPQSVGAVGGSEWRPLFYMSNTCSNLAAFIAPVQDAAQALADDGAAVRMAATIKNFTDPAYDDDPAISLGKEMLEANGFDSNGSQTTGIAFGFIVTEVLRNAADSGELNRVSLMQAVWNQNYPNPYQLDGIDFITDGTNDAFAVEGARIDEIIIDDTGTLTFTAVSDLISVEGTSGSFGG